MSPFLHKLFRGTVLGLMLLLTGAAGMVSFSYDVDNDNDTPPVTIEFNLVTPRRTHVHQIQAEKQNPKSVFLATTSVYSTPVTLPAVEFSQVHVQQESLQPAVPLRL